MKPVKFAVVGCGHIGKRHIEMICGNPEAELVALIDVKEKSCLNIANNGIPFFQCLEAFLQSGIEADVIKTGACESHQQESFPGKGFWCF